MLQGFVVFVTGLIGLIVGASVKSRYDHAAAIRAERIADTHAFSHALCEVYAAMSRWHVQHLDVHQCIREFDDAVRRLDEAVMNIAYTCSPNVHLRAEAIARHIRNELAEIMRRPSRRKSAEELVSLSYHPVVAALDTMEAEFVQEVRRDLGLKPSRDPVYRRPVAVVDLSAEDQAWDEETAAS
jgi:hypothetical protein